MTVLPEITKLQQNMAKDIIGQEEIIEAIVVGILSNGNLLVEGLPGLAKTRAIKALANNIEGTFNRIQFTPDLVSSDITGKEVYYGATEDAKGTFKFIPGPIFNNVVLADEINRAPSKTQNALLEAMEERQVTVAGVAHKVPELFMVMATQNPAGQQGTFPLPEAQMDRFLLHVMVHYPDEEAELNIIRLLRQESSQGERNKTEEQKKAEREEIKQETIFAARGEIDKITVPDHVEKYIVDLIFATRYPQRHTYELKSFIKCGASPRASLALDKTCRTLAWMRGQTEVSIENVQTMLKPVLRHRLIRGERAIEHNITTEDICDEVIELVPLPS